MVKLRTSLECANCILHELKILRKSYEDTNLFLHKLSRYFVHPVSEDNFPTAAERAFTAAGFAALVGPAKNAKRPTITNDKVIS